MKPWLPTTDYCKQREEFARAFFPFELFELRGELLMHTVIGCT